MRPVRRQLYRAYGCVATAPAEKKEKNNNFLCVSICRADDANDDPRNFVRDNDDDGEDGRLDDDDENDEENEDEDDEDDDGEEEEEEEELLQPRRRRGGAGSGGVVMRDVERQVMQAIQQVMVNQRAAAAAASAGGASSSAAPAAAPAAASAGAASPLVDLITSLLGGPQGPSLQRMFGLAGNLGDYAIGDNFQEVVDRLYRDSAAAVTTKPAAAAAIDALPRCTLGAADVVEANGEPVTCAVCKDELVSGDTAVRLQCKHLYHPDCIVQWLKTSGTCPVCRFELPKEEPDDAEKKQKKQPEQP